MIVDRTKDFDDTDDILMTWTHNNNNYEIFSKLVKNAEK